MRLSNLHPAWLTLSAAVGMLVALTSYGKPSVGSAAAFTLIVVIQWGWIYSVYRVAIAPYDTKHWFERDWPYLFGLVVLLFQVGLVLHRSPHTADKSRLEETVGFIFMMFALTTASNTAAAVSDAHPHPRSFLTDRASLTLRFFLAPIGAWLLQDRLKQLRALSEVRANLRDLA